MELSDVAVGGVLGVLLFVLAMVVLARGCAAHGRSASSSREPQRSSTIQIAIDHKTPLPPPPAGALTKSKSSYSRIVENDEPAFAAADARAGVAYTDGGAYNPSAEQCCGVLEEHAPVVTTPRVPPPQVQQQQVRLMAEIRRQVSPVEQPNGEGSAESNVQPAFLAGANVKAVRAAVDEIRETEEDYVHVLQTLVENYLPRVREHLEPAELNTLFGNVTILKGVNETLEQHLSTSIQPSNPSPGSKAAQPRRCEYASAARRYAVRQKPRPPMPASHRSPHRRQAPREAASLSTVKSPRWRTPSR